MSVRYPRVLMFAPYCYPPAGAEAITTAKLVLAARRRGWYLDVLTVGERLLTEPRPTDKVWAPLEALTIPIWATPLQRPVPRLRHRKRGRFWSRARMVVWCIRAYRTARHLMARKDYDAIISRVSPPYGHVPALWLSWRTNVPWIACWSDPMPRSVNLPPLGLGRKRGQRPLTRAYFRAVARRAVWHTFPCQALRRHMSSVYPALREKSSAIPPVAVEALSAPSSPHRDVFRLLHIGNALDLEHASFLRGLKLFSESNRVQPRFHLRMVGTHLSAFRRAAMQLGLSKVVSCTGPVPYDAARRIIAASSACLILEPPQPEGIILPSKISDIVQQGTPMLAVSPRKSPAADIIHGHGGGLSADCSSAEEVAAALERLYSSWVSGSLHTQYGSGALMKVLGESAVMRSYEQLISDLLQAPTGSAPGRSPNSTTTSHATVTRILKLGSGVGS